MLTELTELEVRRYEMFQNGMSYQEIATQENTSRTAIFNSVQKAKEKLGLNDPITLLKSEVENLYKVARNQHEIIINLSTQMDAMSKMIELNGQNASSEEINKLTTKTSMLIHLITKLENKGVLPL